MIYTQKMDASDLLWNHQGIQIYGWNMKQVGYHSFKGIVSKLVGYLF